MVERRDVDFEVEGGDRLTSADGLQLLAQAQAHDPRLCHRPTDSYDVRLRHSGQSSSLAVS
jgi:hypothetical protein